jgi:putative transposon-encoded protein
MKEGTLKDSLTTETFKVYDEMDMVVKRGGNSGRVYVPKAWLGKRVKILLIEG